MVMSGGGKFPPLELIVMQGAVQTFCLQPPTLPYCLHLPQTVLISVWEIPEGFSSPAPRWNGAVEQSLLPSSQTGGSKKRSRQGQHGSLYSAHGHCGKSALSLMPKPPPAPHTRDTVWGTSGSFAMLFQKSFLGLASWHMQHLKLVGLGTRVGKSSLSLLSCNASFTLTPLPPYWTAGWQFRSWHGCLFSAPGHQGLLGEKQAGGGTAPSASDAQEPNRRISGAKCHVCFSHWRPSCARSWRVRREGNWWVLLHSPPGLCEGLEQLPFSDLGWL